MTNEVTMASTASPYSPRGRVYTKAILCLVIGVGAGYLFRGSQSSPPPTPRASGAGQPSTVMAAMGDQPMPSAGQRKQMPGPPTQPSAQAGPHSSPRGAMGTGHMPTLEEMKQMADTQAAPMLEKLKKDPNNSALLSQVGAIYHTTHQFKQAAVYYDKAVHVDPRSVAMRTKLASSLYRSGDVDGAIAQLNEALRYDPKDANSLFDLGMIKLQGKQDGKGALAAWQRLLKSNPQLSADRKATVEKLMADVLTTLGDQQRIQGAGQP
jgi:predicted Zn-dependent protease